MQKINEDRLVDARNLLCPMPVLATAKELRLADPGQVVKVLATDRGSVLDMQGWAKTNPKISLLKQETQTDEQGREVFVHYLQRKV